MAKSVSVDASSSREKKWNKIFKALAESLQIMQKDKEYLEERIKCLQEIIHQIKMEQNVETGKASLMLGLKKREAFIYMKRCASVDGLLADFGELCQYLSQKCAEPQDGSDDISCKMGSKPNKLLQDEVQNLKRKLEEKNNEFSTLLGQKNFVWNQFNKMESDLTNELKKKCDEAEHANAKVQVLVKRAEKLEFLNESLRTNFAQIKSEKVQMSKEISRLLKEIEQLKSKSGSATPILRRCRTEAGTSNNTIRGRAKELKKEPSSSHTSERMGRSKPSADKSMGGTTPRKKLGIKVDQSSKGKAHVEEDTSSKRKRDNVIVIDDTPKLFTSSFKVPKLKSWASPRVV